MSRLSNRVSWQSLALAMVAARRDSGLGESPRPIERAPEMAGSYWLGAPFTAYEGTQRDSAWGTYPITVIATEGRLRLGEDGTYEHQLQLETRIGGQLAHRGRWGDRGSWTSTRDGLAFESKVIQSLAFTGVGSEGRLCLMQDVVGEGRLAAFPYTRQGD